MAKIDKDNKVDEIVDVEDVANVEELDETAALASLKPGSQPPGKANKSWAFGKIVNAVAGMDHETINKFVAMIDQIGHEADSIPGGDAVKNKNSIETKPSGAAAQVVNRLESVEIEDALRAVIQEDVATLFEGDDLSEDFKTKVGTIIESAINMKVAAAKVTIEEAYEAKLAEEVEEIAKDLIGTIELAVDAIAEQWLVDNEVAVVSTLRADLTEQFLEDLHGLFATHYIDVPEDKIDILEDQAARIEELEALASQALEENLSLKAAISEATEEAEIEQAIEEAATGLVATDVEKLRNLAESVEFSDVAEFKSKLGILKEAHFSTTTPKSSSSMLFEENAEIISDEELPKPRPGVMDKYVQAIERSIR
jgi:hypothetical protein